MSSDSARDAAVADEPEVGAGDTGDAEGFGDAADDTVDEPADETAGEAADESEPVATEADSRKLLPKRLLLGSAALALASFIVAAVFGVMWLVTATGEQADLATSRNAVADSASNAVQAVTEIDYQNPDEFFQRSKAVSTEDFGKQLTKAEDSLRKALAKAKTTVDTQVMDVAVQQLNDHEGTATFLAVARTDISQGDRNATKMLRLKGQMERVSTGGGQQWKLAGLSEVPVVGSGASAPNAGSGAQQGAGQKSGQGAGQGAQQGSGQSSGPGK